MAITVPNDPLVGVDAAWTYREVDFLLGEGDALLLATDGITEARRANSDGDSLRCEGLALDASRAGGPPGRVARAVLGGAKAFVGGRFHDDASVLVAIQR
jgi:sigma-B regulation protein RsbU (phosphoserine phosphatase)